MARAVRGRKPHSRSFAALTEPQKDEFYAAIDAIRSKRIAERPRRVFLPPKILLIAHPYRYGERYIPGDLSERIPVVA